jgi:ankyrin repeat protein
MVQSIHINSFPSELLRSTVVAAIWIPYFIYSKRVKNTFYGVQNQNAITQESENILIKGAINGDVELIKAQIAIGEDVETKDNSGFTPLIWAACEGHLDCLKTLIKLGANVNATDNDDNNVLFWSINENKKACFIELIKAGANIEYRDKDGFTTFMWAIYLCRIEMIKILKESGADIRSVDNSGNGAKYWAQSGFEEGKMSAQDYASILKLIDN